MPSDSSANRLLELRNSNGRLRATVELVKVADRIEGALKLHNLNGGPAGISNGECLDAYLQGGRLRIELDGDRINFWNFLGKKVFTLRTAPARLRAGANEPLQAFVQLMGVADKKSRLGVVLVSDPEGLGEIAPWRLRLLPLDHADRPGQILP